ncbi:Do family serine endopeptidase [Thermopetrobacter sp. TC1]|uniref:Do family serine endopeptidase n=1 Tax=Thermopetrobacter sp. TC1 TaxID=1495045 RepID=UPI001E47500F|nr:Do family serine endopeptidase [Thermopetrobacter sp. TC1]
MKRSLMALVMAGALSATALGGLAGSSVFMAVPAQAKSVAPAQGFADLVEKVMPAVVSVEVEYQPVAGEDAREMMRKMPGLDRLPPEFRKFFEDFGLDRFGFHKRFPRMRPGKSVGSGFFISPDGYVVTNNHVVKNASVVKIKTNDGKTYTAKVVGTDPKTDLALLKVDAKGKTFPYVEFAEKDPRVGDWVVAVGNPFGFGGTVTTGIVSAKGRQIGAGPYDDFLQIDAPINKGNSGGPAFNLEGKVVGVNTAIFSPTGGSVGIGFAIPASVAKEVIMDLKTKGRVTRGWLGVQIQKVTPDIAESLGLDEPKGAIVVKVTEDSPAKRAGFKVGDTVLEVNGKTVKGPRDLARKIAHITPGETARIVVLRDGARKTLTVKIGQMPSDEKIAKAFGEKKAEPASVEALGLKLKTADDGQGVMITAVAPGSQAEKKGLKPGDIITEVAGIEVDSPEAVKAAIAKAVKKGKKAVLFLVRSGDVQRFVALSTKSGKKG